MALPATDDFNRANGSLGANWTVIDGNLQVVSNRCAGVDGQSNASFWSADVFNADHYSQAKVYDNGGGTWINGPMVRASGTRGYLADVESSGGTIKIQRLNSAENFTVLQTITSLTIVAGDVIRLEAQGTTLRVYQNGVQLGTDQTDATYSDGSAGLFIYSTGTSSELDDWEGGNLGVAATGTPFFTQLGAQRISMAFPSIRSSVVTNGTGASATPVVNLPATIRAGDTLIVYFKNAVAGVIGFPADWNELVDASPDASVGQIGIAWKKATGADGSSITLSSGNGKFAAIARSIQGAIDPTVQPPQISTVAIGTTGEPNATVVTPTGGAKDYLWDTVYLMEGEQTGITANPSGYTLDQQFANSGTAAAVTTNCTIGAVGRTNNAASEDAGVWDVTGTLDDSSAYTVAFHPAVPLPEHLMQGRRVESLSAKVVRRPLSVAIMTVAGSLLLLQPPPTPTEVYTTQQVTLIRTKPRPPLWQAPNLLTSTLGEAPPFVSVNWPVPKRTSMSAKDRTWITYYVFDETVPTPFAPAIWANPRAPRRVQVLSNTRPGPAEVEVQAGYRSFAGIWLGGLSSSPSIIELDLSGSIASVGILAQMTSKSLTGTAVSTSSLVHTAMQFLFGTVTPTGTLIKTITKLLIGALTPSGSVVNVETKLTSGSIASAGSLSQTITKLLASSIASGSSLSQTITKILASSIASSGVLTAVKMYSISLTGSIVSTAAIVNSPTKVLTGTIASASALTQSISKILTGAIASTGALNNTITKLLTGSIASSGVLVSVKVAILELTGSLTSVGALTKSVTKILSGSIASASTLTRSLSFARTLTGSIASAGALSKTVTKLLAGTIASSSVVTNVKVAIQTLTGSIASSAALSKTVSDVTNGTVAAAGSLTDAVTRLLSGSITSTGSVVRTISLFKTGTIASSGATSNSITKLLAGTITSVSVLVKNTTKVLSGLIIPSGVMTVLSSTTSLSLSGTIASSGSLVKSVTQVLTGLVTPTGSLSKAISHALASVLPSSGDLHRTRYLFTTGNLTSSGVVSMLVSRSLTGLLTVTGDLSHAVSQALNGTIASSAALFKTVTKVLDGVITIFSDITSLVGAQAFAEIIEVLGSYQNSISIMGSYSSDPLDTTGSYSDTIDIIGELS